MENRTEFELDAVIQRWRENLNQSPQFRAENVEELESHLRDAVAMWRAKGLSEEEGFLIAARRLGGAGALEPEFAKVNSKEVWLDRVLWMAVGIQVLWLLTGISSLLAELAVVGGLTSLGYHFTFTPGRFLAGGFIPVALFTLFQISALALGVWACWLLVRRREKALAIFGACFFRRRFFIGLALVPGGVLLVRLVAMFDTMLLLKWFSKDQFGIVTMSKSMANVFLSLAMAITLAGLTVFLARRRLRLRTNQ